MSFKVLIPQDITDAGKDYLVKRGYEVIIGTDSSVETICKEVVDCDAILARTALYPKKVMEAGKKLKVISRYGAGTDNIDINSATELGIQITNAPVANCNSVAEHTIALILACASNIAYMDNQVRKGNWEERNRTKSIEVENKVLGLIGLGRIGRSVASKAYNGLGMKVIGYDPYISSDNRIENIEIVDDINEVYKKADFISLHIPATAETKGTVNGEAFRIMKNTAYLINCARGEIVNEDDLYDALTSNQIKGAAIDVMCQEPPVSNHPLFELNNLIFSPHNGALTVEAMDRMGIHAAMGIDEVLTGLKPTWPVNIIK
ncbi:hydroxyacid dehydrogenase [Tissierella sp. Yu-01]|uniref:hydroxyacid dehydrogenase n=1 Tax=Tissierella sp. Yu-01 TaxID=3035694 RepID=UPI00240E2B01|nr:hydroxyacid dehydrogenase [Tissierella sp. Yu-01]WFA08072.1 hydroxyacid dehydrogenase [Tissierella sp. Yu-01]